MTKDPKPGTAQWLVARTLDAIASGELAPGAQIPTVPALVEKHGMNKNTVSKALQELKRVGAISGVSGSKTWVRVPPKHVKRRNVRYHEEKDAVHAVEAERASKGVSELDSGIAVSELHENSAKFTIMNAPEDIAEILHLPENSQVLCRVYTRRHAAQAGISVSTSYLPLALVAKNADILDETREPWPGGTMHQLFTVGIEIGEIVDHVTAAMPTPDEMRDYDIPPGVPLIHIRKVSYAVDGRPVEVALIPSPADRIELIYSTPLVRWS